MKHLLVIVCIFVCISCSDKPSQIAENDASSFEEQKQIYKVISESSPKVQPPEWEEAGSCIGIARMAADHSEKLNRASVLIGSEAYLFRGNYSRFTDQVIGKTIKVTGDIKQGRLPMFIALPSDELHFRSGIPMPPGTDLEKESRYYYIENPKWEILN